MTPEELAAGGLLVLPAFAEPHAHLDKAFLAERVLNPTGDLLGAILAMEAARPQITVADTVERAERAVRLMVANGTTAIRTHADTTTSNGLTSVEALLEVRKRVAPICDVQVVALTGFPSLGPVGADVRALLGEAIAMGVDAVGGCPHLEDEAAAANEQFLTIAAAAGLPLDLHVDETLDPAVLGVRDLARRVLASGFPHRVTASHCVSLSMQDERTQHEVAELLAEAGIAVVALPQTNLFLQGRDHRVAMPRGVTAVHALQAAGVTVAAGADNLQDPFNPVGRGDPLETAGLMIATAHLLPEQALAAVTDAPRSLMGAPAGDWVGIPAASAREAIAFGPGSRTVIRDGRVIVHHGEHVSGT